MMTKKISCKEAAERLQACTSAHILIHQSPDGDCIGCGYALAQALWSLGKTATVLCSDPYPKRYQFLVPEDAAAHAAPETPDLIVSVDVADAKLLGNALASYQDRVQLAIDHHFQHREFAAELCMDAEASSACQVLYEVLEAMDAPLTPGVALCLYTGIATDTGGFLFDNVSPKTLRILAELRERRPELPYGRINRELFLTKNKKRLHIEQLLTEQLEDYYGGRCILLSVSEQLCQDNHLAPEDFDGFAGFPLQLEGAEIGLLLREKEPNVWKVSMRSADLADVSAICTQFGGGGHIKASGCTLEGTLSEVRVKLLAAVRKELERL